MLLPLAAAAFVLFRGLRTYPRDIATAAAAGQGAARPRGPDPSDWETGEDDWR